MADYGLSHSSLPRLSSNARDVWPIPLDVSSAISILPPIAELILHGELLFRP